MLTRRTRRTFDIWPGFVDALATLLLVIIFVLLVFVMAQYFLGAALSGREQALSQLGSEMASLAEQLSLEKKENEALQTDRTVLSEQLAAAANERGKLTQSVAALEALKAQLQAKITDLDTKLSDAGGAIQSEKRTSEEARAEIALMSQQMQGLRDQLTRVMQALDISEKTATEQKVQIVDLGRRLNNALASKVEELQRYRSEFFGKLHKVLGDKPGVKIEGDRFVFQSELLFDTGSAELGLEGTEQVKSLAKTLNEIAGQIPEEVHWVLRIDGHTDKRPITGRYPSNWELSAARAITVLRTLVANGVSANRVAAAGFGEFQPLDTGDTEVAYAKNRRIEIRFDAR